MQHSAASPSPDRSATSTVAPADTISLIGGLNVLLRHGKLIVGAALVFFTLGYAIVALRPTEYEAESKFLLHSASSPTSGVSGFAAQLGLSTAGGAAGESMEFYAMLLKSRALLLRAAESNYRVARAKGDTVSGALANFYEEIPRGTRAVGASRAAMASAILGDGIDVETDTRTGLVTLRTKAPYPELAEGVNRRLLELVNDFNLRRRQSQAATERRFVEDRMQQAQAQLQAAEQDQESFLEQNRRYQESPQLSVTAQRLQRRIELRQGIYVSLAQAYEQARIQEVRDTPLITVIESPDGTAGSTAGNRIRGGIVGALLGIFLAVVIAFISHYVTRVAPSDATAYGEFRRIVLASPFAMLSRQRAKPPI